MSEGVQTRHRKACATHRGGRCSCSPSYRAAVYDRRDGSRVTRSFPTLAQARRWRADTYRDLETGLRRAQQGRTVREASERLLDGMSDGTVRNRSGDAYKPSAIRSYRTALKLRILPEVGGIRLGELRRATVQRLADHMLSDGASPSTIRNTLMPLRVICRRAIEDGELTVSPCDHLRLPAVRGRRDRVASIDEMHALLDALPPDLEALYATAFYAGLRRGELRALRWGDVDLAAGRITVRKGMDDTGVMIEPKSVSGARTIPIVQPLADVLERHRAGDLDIARDRHVFFGRRAFTPSTVRRRAETAWKRAGLAPVRLHECRHTFASILIAAGINAKAICTFCGHSSIEVTYDLYGKLMPGSEDEMVSRVESYLIHCTTVDTMAARRAHG